MGIEKFFNSLVKNETIQKDNILALQNKIEADYVYIDFNSILYKIATQIETELNKLFFELLIDKNNITNESKDIALKWKYNIRDYTLDNFKTYFNEKSIDEQFFNFITEDLYNILDELINGKSIKKLYIAMDGVPNMSKIVEQKKRRYMGYILNESKRQIYNNTKSDLNKLRQIYEENKISISRSKILGFHSFMQNISLQLKEKEFTRKLKKRFPSLVEYFFSGSNVPGEGEKKIMEDILNKKNKGKYVLYSPDADVIILSSIMINKLPHDSEIYVLRFDQQELKYDIIDITVLNNNIFNYIDLNNQNKLSKKEIINDIMFIFTMFGNDFVHKIESINPKKDFEILLDVYSLFLKVSKDYIIDKNSLNYNSIREYFNLLSDYEKDLLNDVYLIRNYKNYNHLKHQFKEIFWFKTLHRTLINYTLLSNIIFKYIRKWEVQLNINKKFTYWNITKKRYEIDFHNLHKFIEKEHKTLINELLKYDYNLSNNISSVKKKFNSSNYIRQFLKMYLTIELNVDLEKNDIIDRNLYFNFVDILKKEIFKHDGRKIYANIIPNIKLDKFKYTTNDKYHNRKISEKLISDRMNLTKYDTEIYAFEFMLDKYKNRLNAMDDQIGKCYLNYINNQYVYIYDIIEKYHHKYYKTYFGDRYNTNDISEKYFEGICWVFDFYFLKNDSEFNFNNVSTWFYKYNRSPLLIDFSNYIKRKSIKELKQTHHQVVNRLINRDEFMNSVEHYLYVTPKNSLNLGKYYDIFKNVFDHNPYLFPDLDIIVEKILCNSKITSEYNENIPIDCRRVSYFSKCTLKTIREINFSEFMSIIKPFRRIYDNIDYDKEPFYKNLFI